MTARLLRCVLPVGLVFVTGCNTVPDWVSQAPEGSMGSGCAQQSFRLAEMRALPDRGVPSVVTEYVSSHNGEHLWRSSRVADRVTTYTVVDSWQGEYQGQYVKCVLVRKE